MTTAPSFAPGATLSGDGVEFAVYSHDAARVELNLVGLSVKGYQ